MAAAQTGKRYVVPGGVAEFIVTKGGAGELRCGDAAMQMRGAEDASVKVDTAGMEALQGRRDRHRSPRGQAGSMRSERGWPGDGASPAQGPSFRRLSREARVCS